LSTRPPTPPTSTLYPYTTLFRSHLHAEQHLDHPRLRPHHRNATRSVLRSGAGVQRGDDAVLEVRPGRWATVARPVRCLGVLSRRSEEHTSELQSRGHLVCRLLLE